MTTYPAAAPQWWPSADTPVLLNRKINPSADPASFSVFGDDWWNLTPGMFESHLNTSRLNFEAVPLEFRQQVKLYVWLLINSEAPKRLRGQRGGHLSLTSIYSGLPKLNAFVLWLHGQNITSFGAVTAVELDRYLTDVILAAKSREFKGLLIGEVRRMWSYREYLPEPMRLPAAKPWSGETNKNLLGKPSRSGENRTPPINAKTMELLLMWSLRLVENFADDIIAAFDEYKDLYQYSPYSINRYISGQDSRLTRSHADEILPELNTYLQELRDTGGGLPGRFDSKGNLEVNWAHMARILRGRKHLFEKSSCTLRRAVERAGLPISDACFLNSPINGQLGDAPWRATRIDYYESVELATMLRTACVIVLTYLSGMRPGEVLNLERGCASYNPDTDVWSIRGRHFKGVSDRSGSKVPEGQLRDDPWVIVAPVARAVEVLERLHRQQLLVPNQIQPHFPRQGRTRQGQGLLPSTLTGGIAEFMTWIESYCGATGRHYEIIPSDPKGPIALSRFRRTLAWHIVRRPRGLVAAAIQYGHVHVQMTLGYSGAYESGFPDEYAFEEWIYRLERLAEDHRLLVDGEQVSGPAANAYRYRVEAGYQQFAGRVLTNVKYAEDMLNNHLLQVYSGKAMTCVFDPAKALCQVRGAEGDVRLTPDQNDCRTACRNIAYTDRDIALARTRATELRALLGEFLAPSPRYSRVRSELERLERLIRDHGRRPTRR